MFENILVPLDGSEHSIRALETAIQIAKKFNGKITLIHVYSVAVRPIIIPEPTTLTPPGVPVMTPDEVSKIVEAARKIGAEILANGEQKVNAEKVPVKTMLVEGQVSSEIVKTAREENCALIVMGARGISRIKEILLGSVSDAVIRNAPCPVLVVK